jgi:hypothetical protein
VIPIETWEAKAGRPIRSVAAINIIVKKRFILSLQPPVPVIGNPLAKGRHSSKERYFNVLGESVRLCRPC